MPGIGRSFGLVAVMAVMLTGFPASPSVFSQYAPGGAVLKGTVKSSDGKPMEGVTVSVRGEGKTFVTTVFTDQQGRYLFPRLEKGKYKLWAQAVGFEAARLEVDVAGSDAQQAAALELKPLTDFHKQLSANEWIASLPEKDPRDARMKAILVNNCTGCHPIGYPLQNRFDATGWARIITLMAKISGQGFVPPEVRTEEVLPAVMNAYKEELASYLAEVRGPASQPLNPKVLQRPTGEATRAVITEFDLPRPEAPPSVLKFDGSDWSEGTPSSYAGRAAHDVAIDHNGNVFWADDIVPDRSIGKLDPKTGKVTAFKLADADGNTAEPHTMITAPNGNLWMTNRIDGTFVSFDPKTEKFTKFPRPDSMAGAGGTVTVDAKGNPWAGTGNGAVGLDASTGKYTFYKALHPGITYGITVDAEQKVWFAQPGNDKIGVVDTVGSVSEVTLPPFKGVSGNDKDRELAATLKLGQNNATPLQKGPRRLMADPKGNYVWVAEYFADQLARIDIHTKEVKEYPVPHRWSQPYAVAVDKNHNVWLTMMDQDRLEKFNPITEQFTEYQLPTRGTEIRHILPDNTSDPPAIWVPYNRVNKIARIQFRTESEMQ